MGGGIEAEYIGTYGEGATDTNCVGATDTVERR